MYFKLTGIAILALALVAPLAAAVEADTVVGVWWTEGMDARVEVFKLDKAKAAEQGIELDAEELDKLDGTYCGKIIWLKDQKDEDGNPILDSMNPDEAKQSRPIIGLFMVYGFTFNADKGLWESGNIYDPDEGKTYKCMMTLDKTDPSKLNVRGYIGAPVFGKTTVWTKYEAEEGSEG